MTPSEREPPGAPSNEGLREPGVGAPLPRPGRSFQRSAWLVLTAALVVAGVWILWDFLAALAWATIFAIATWPVYRRFCARLSVGSEVGAPLAFTVLVGLVFIVPAAFLAVQVGHEALALARLAAEVEKSGINAPDWLGRLPFGGYLTQWWQANLADPNAAAMLLGRLDKGVIIEWTRTVGTQLLRRSTVLVFTLLTLFFLYRDGTSVTRQLTAFADRVFGPAGERLGAHIVTAVRGTVNGLVLVGMGEGALLGIAYAAFGLPRPALLGAFTGVFAMIPFGAPLVFSIGALLLLAQSKLVSAIALFAFGSAVVFVADHFIRPVLIGSAVRLPFLWVLLGILGGLEGFGLVGLFLGPAVMAALIALWREWAEAPPERR